MMTNNPIGPVTAALGAEFEKFQALARMVAEQPATRPYAEREMARLLEAMPEDRRIAIRAALLAEMGPQRYAAARRVGIAARRRLATR